MNAVFISFRGQKTKNLGQNKSKTVKNLNFSFLLLLEYHRYCPISVL